MNRKLRQLTIMAAAVLALLLCASNGWSLTTGVASSAPTDVSIHDYEEIAHTDSIWRGQAPVAVTVFTYDHAIPAAAETIHESDAAPAALQPILHRIPHLVPRPPPTDASTTISRFLNAPKSVATQHGPAVQSTTAEAQAALQEARSGAPVYRAGKLGTQHGAEGQFWSFENPASTPGYTGQMGMPSGGIGEPFIMGGRVNPASPVITRPAPGIKANTGGAMEAVTPPGGVTLDWFHMP